MSDVKGPALAREQIIEDIAVLLGVPPAELTDDTNLLDAGLDSIRLMSLVEKWRAAGSAGADFVNLASEPVVGVWVDAVTGDDENKGANR